MKISNVVISMFLIMFLFMSITGCKKNSSDTDNEKVNQPALEDIEVYTVDSVSHKIVKVTMKKGETFPLTNPETGEKTLWKAYYCNDCKTVFGEKPGTKATNCPKCGSTDFTPDRVKDHLDAPVWDK